MSELSKELIIQAYNEAIEFTTSAIVYDGNSVVFLSMWQHGEWSEIRKEFPAFNLDSPAQRALIESSGGGL